LRHGGWHYRRMKIRVSNRTFQDLETDVRTFASILSLVALAGCASHNWTPGPQASGDFSVVSGQCKLEAAKAPISGYTA
jgi:hypothetical protein